MERYGSNIFKNEASSKFKEPVSSNLMAAAGFSWPPRSYNCSFCKREFKSAQALGGHMNVHRRDRARLRQSPPWDPPPLSSANPNSSSNTSSNPNVPNLNFPPPPCTNEARPSPVTYSFLSPVACSPSPKVASWTFRSSCDVKDFFEVKRNEREKVGFGSEFGVHGDVDEDLDLELRLGYM